MAAGIWKKIKNGLSKMWNGIKTGAKWINKNIIQPVVRPVMNALRPAADAIPLIGPGFRAAQAGVDFASNLIDGKPKERQQAANWVSSKIQPRLK